MTTRRRFYPNRRGPCLRCLPAPFSRYWRSSAQNAAAPPSIGTRTRRSTSGGCVIRSSHLLCHWRASQSTVALPSGEAGLTGICKGASEALSMRPLCRDLGLTVGLTVLSDAAAAIGICRRRGLACIGQLPVVDQWVRDRVRVGEVHLKKIVGSENTAGALTTYVHAATMNKHMSTLSLCHGHGRADSVPTRTHCFAVASSIGPTRLRRGYSCQQTQHSVHEARDWMRSGLSFMSSLLWPRWRCRLARQPVPHAAARGLPPAALPWRRL